MRQSYLTIAALLCVSSVAFAQSDPRAAGAAPSGDQRYPVVASAGLQPARRIVRNANDCAPDRARAVWGASPTPIGYACAGSTR